MKFTSYKLQCWIIIAGTTFLCIRCVADSFKMGITVSQTHIKVGEPLLIGLTRSYEEPRISEVTKKTSPSIRIEHLRVEAKDVNDKVPQKTFGLMPVRLILQDAEGLEYKGIVDIFYDDSLGLVFDRAGTYKVRVLSPSGKFGSNSIEIVVKPPSAGEEKALSFFEGVEDFAFLMGGIFKSPTTISHLEQVVEQCGDTMLGKWSAARLGIEEYKEFRQKYPATVEFMFQYRRGEVQEPLVEESYDHLTNALELPDEFPIKQEVLYHLVSIEIIKGNNTGALSYANELSQKYPKGEFGKRVSVAELQDEIARLDSQMADLEQQRREKIEEMAKWLEELWLTDEGIRQTIEPNQWQQFIESVKEQR